MKFLIWMIIHVPQLSQPNDGGGPGHTKTLADGLQRLLVQIGESPLVILERPALGKLPHSKFHLLLWHEESGPQDASLPFVPVLPAF